MFITAIFFTFVCERANSADPAKRSKGVEKFKVWDESGGGASGIRRRGIC